METIKDFTKTREYYIQLCRFFKEEPISDSLHDMMVHFEALKEKLEDLR